jgi:acyl-[acyl-carrier-protein] desaturase
LEYDSVHRSPFVNFNRDDELLGVLEEAFPDILERHLRLNDHAAHAPQAEGSPVDEAAATYNRRAWLPYEVAPDIEGPRISKDDLWTPASTRSNMIEYVATPLGRAAVLVNGITEEKLPGYFAEINQFLGPIFAEWSNRWTAEEHKHGVSIKNYIDETLVIDPRVFESLVFTELAAMNVPHPKSTLHGVIYVVIQELMTKIAHANTGEILDDDGYNLFTKHLAIDETNHHVVYLSCAKVAFQHDPSRFITAYRDVIRDFGMPGEGLAEFKKLTQTLALGGILSAADYAKHFEAIVSLKDLNIWAFDDSDLTPEAAQARQEIVKIINLYKRAANMLQADREKILSGNITSPLFHGIIVGQTHKRIKGELVKLDQAEAVPRLNRFKLADYQAAKGVPRAA